MNGAAPGSVGRARPVTRRWSRLRHPLCGSPLGTLFRLLREAGPPSARGAPTLAFALGCALLRWPFTALQRDHVARHRPAAVPAPLFIIGHWRSGTTHLYNILARSPAFATVPPVAAGLPLEHLPLGRWLRPLLDRILPETRFIDGHAITTTAPQEDEIAIAVMGGPSFLDACHFPRHFERLLARSIFLDGVDAAGRAEWTSRLLHFYATLLLAQPGRRLLIKNPVYMVRLPELLQLWPDAQFIHIHRDALEVFESTCRLYASMLDNFALQAFGQVPIEPIVLATYERLIARFEQDKQHLAPGQLAELSLDALRRDPESTLAGVYRRLCLPGFAAARQPFAAYCAVQGAHRPQPEHVAAGPARERLLAWRARLDGARVAEHR